MTAAPILTIESLQNQLSSRESKIQEQDAKILYLEEQLEWCKRQIFGKKSERIVKDLNQDQLKFEGFTDQSPSKEETQTIPAHERKQRSSTGEDKIQLPPDLPVEKIVLDIPEDEKICKETGIPLVKIGEEISYKLAHRPGSYYLKEIIRPKYAHPTKEERGILIASMPDSIIPKCRADESLLAKIIVEKFADHLPLYRIAEGLSRDGIVISRRLLSQWVVRLGSILKPLYDEMKRLILESGHIYIDESPVKILDSPQTKQGYMWVIVGGHGSDPPYRIYDFKEDRKHEHVPEMLQGYCGILHSDKYGAYQTYVRDNGNVWMPCWAHIRRKFFEAEMGDRPLREWVLEQIKKLFDLEALAWQQSPEARLEIRQTQEVPLIDELIERIKKRLTEGKILPKSKFKEALGYFCSLIPYMKNYTQHPFARIDNNVAERAIRPLAIGRKNWLFFGSMESGQSAAVLLSLVQTCRGLGVNPREYLEDVFRLLMGHSSQKLRELLPDEWRRAKAAVK
jgi:transposase